MTQSLVDLGRQVREARRARGWLQLELARRAGVSRFTVIKLERGQLADINFKTLASILDPLGFELRVENKPVSGLPVLGEPRRES